MFGVIAVRSSHHPTHLSQRVGPQIPDITNTYRGISEASFGRVARRRLGSVGQTKWSFPTHDVLAKLSGPQQTNSFISQVAFLSRCSPVIQTETMTSSSIQRLTQIIRDSRWRLLLNGFILLIGIVGFGSGIYAMIEESRP